MTLFIDLEREHCIFTKYFFVIIYILFFIWLALIGFFIDLHWGIFFGFGFASIIFFLFVFWGEKVLLYVANARYVSDDELLINQVKNFSWHLGLREVRIFSSAHFPNNVYYARSYLGSPTLIIGKYILQNFSRTELNSLVYATLLRLKAADSKRRTMVSLLLLILFLPVFFFRKIFSDNHNSFINVFLYPGYYLKSYMYSSARTTQALDKEVASLEGLRKEYISAIFKISNLEVSSRQSAGDFLLYELTHIPNQETDALFELIQGESNTKERIRALAGI